MYNYNNKYIVNYTVQWYSYLTSFEKQDCDEDFRSRKARLRPTNTTNSAILPEFLSCLERIPIIPPANFINMITPLFDSIPKNCDL